MRLCNYMDNYCNQTKKWQMYPISYSQCMKIALKFCPSYSNKSRFDVHWIRLTSFINIDNYFVIDNFKSSCSCIEKHQELLPLVLIIASSTFKYFFFINRCAINNTCHPIIVSYDDKRLPLLIKSINYMLFEVIFWTID